MIINTLIESSLLLLFLVSAVGYALGRIRIKGASLGVAAVLFVGLAVGALDPNLKIPQSLFDLGLVLFVYTVGLTSGPGFFASFRSKGLRDNLFAVAVLAVAALVAVAEHFALRLPATVTSGLYAGALTNTPALASVIDTITNTAPAGMAQQMANEPTVGYSVAYPMGVLGVILTSYVLQRVWHIDFRGEARKLRGIYLVEQELYNRTVRVTQPDAIGQSIQQLVVQRHWHVVFARLQRGDDEALATATTVIEAGDLVSVVGAPEDVDVVVAALGELTDYHLELDRSHYDFRRVFVSSQKIAGRQLGDLRLPQEYGAIVTRVRRGDVDLLAESSTVLELGDRVRVVAPRERIDDVSVFFGDSYKALSEIDLLALGLGLSIGLLIGMITIPLPGGASFKLGNALGPLIAGLVLGALRRTGPIVWTLPYSANLTVRQIGLILLLASIGLRSGYTFVQTLGGGNGLTLFIAGALITFTVSISIVVIGYKVLKIPFGLLTGMLAGVHTQPAVLGFALEQSEDEMPNTGYALLFPIATVTKIVMAQLLLLLLK
ncbi:MAG TPA: aspartate:alanine exchanger family transporter [Anaerolineae bacterium]|nr:aspartate:alanine exchanger family transporter [Anaerolineae bacterium]